MIGLIATNLRRHVGRTVATAIGIAIGVATIVALLSLGSGLKQTAGELIHLGQADLGIFQKGVSDPTASVLPASLAERLEKRSEVERATPMLLVIRAVSEEPAAVLFGVDPKGFISERAVITEGTKTLDPKHVLIGDQLAASLDAHPGSKITLKRRDFTVAGVYHTGIFFEDTGAMVDLATAQSIERRPGDATTIAVELAPDTTLEDAERQLTSALPGTQAIGTADDAARAGANGNLISKAVILTGALALIVGGLGVANTMAMAVLERERELALLSAVGWRPRRLAALVLAEGVATSVLGAGIGLVLGGLGANLLGDALGVSGVVSPHVTPWTIGQALLIGVLIGVLGGLYPAWRATSVSGVELLSRA
ncbi:MAG: FtsX-like permease family protein [Solirubrobacterales bacterium]|nr:FtsX-like permease family protein [Solirubrobacterales bacterium]